MGYVTENSPEHLLETWDIHNRINLYTIEAIEQEDLKHVSASKGRTVGEQFAHIHNVRLMCLKQTAPELIGKLKKVVKEDATDKRLLYKVGGSNPLAPTINLHPINNTRSSALTVFPLTVAYLWTNFLIYRINHY